MALYSVLKADVDDQINTNGIQAITGAIHNDIMNELIDAVGAAQVYVNPTITENPNSPSSPQNPRAYIALPGTYTNFGGEEITAPLGVIGWDGSAWTATNLPIPSPYNYFRCRTTAIMTSGTTITSIAIEPISSLGWTAYAGQWIQLVNRRTGGFDLVQLTADMAPDDTSISVNSYTLTNTFPAHSIVECYPTLNIRKWTTIPVVGAGLNFVNVDSSWRMPPVETIQYIVYLELLEVFRNGLPCRYAATPTEEREYKLDATDRTKVIFGTDFVSGEEVSIRYIQPTIL